MGAKHFTITTIAIILLICIAQNVFAENNIYLVVLEKEANADIVAKYGEIGYRFQSINAVTARLTTEAAQKLSQEPGIKSIEEDKEIQIGPSASKQKEKAGSELTVLSEQTYATTYTQGSQWNLGEMGINAEAAWNNFNVNGKEVKIAIMDSGVDYTIDDLKAPKYLGGRDICATNDCWAWPPIEDDNPIDEYGHGTEMASAMLAAGGTLSGVAPNAQYYAIKISDNQGKSTIATLWMGLDWTLSNLDVDIVYIGGRTEYTIGGVYELLLQYYPQGVLFVAPTYKGLLYHGLYREVIGVGAHNKDAPQDINAETGDYAEVLAPGEAIPVLTLGGTQTTAPDSISVAAAQVAGALALMINYNRVHKKGYNNTALWSDLNYSAIDLWAGNPLAGGGKADVNAALTWIDQNWFIEYNIGYMNSPARDGSTAVYHIGENMDYNITITNNSNKTIYDLNIVSQQLYYEGSQAGQPISGTPESHTLIRKLGAGESTTIGPYSFTLPVDVEPGISSTQITLKTRKPKTSPPWEYYEGTIHANPFAGLFKTIVSQWNLSEQGINAESTWSNFAVSGQGVKIALIGSGVNHALPDLDEHYLSGYDFVNGDTEPDDVLGLGTKQASVILGEEQEKVKGVAPQAGYYALKVVKDDGTWEAEDIAAAIEWAIEHEVDIIFFGFGYSAWSSAEWDPVKSAFAAGIVLVGPSGKTGDNYAYCPACYPEVVAVGAHTESQGILANSNGGVDVVAPGENIPYISKDGVVLFASSTGVAAAHAAGSVALMLQLAKRNGKQYSNAYYRETLMHSAIDLGLDPVYQGAGKVDVNAALTWMQNNWFLGYKVNYLEPDTRDRWGWPIYYKGQEMQYSITVKNNSDQITNSKTIFDLNVVSKQTINGTEYEFFTVIPELLPGKTTTVGSYAVSIPKQFSIPPDWEPSNRNTQVVLKKEREVNHWPPSPWFVLKLTSVLENDDKAGAFKVLDEPLPPNPPVQFCSDSDAGVDPFVFGTCTDNRGTFSDQSLLANGSNGGGRVRSGAYVLEAFCLTEEMRQHCALDNGPEYCNNLPNECYAAPLLPSSALAWTYFDRNDALYVCQNGSYNGKCVAGSAVLSEGDAPVDDNALDTNSAEPPLQALNAPELEVEPEPQASPPAQNSGSSGGGGGGGYFSNNNKTTASTAEQGNESEAVEASAVSAEKKEENNAATVTMAEPMRETQTEPKRETVSSVLPVENAASPVGFVLAQNALNAVIVIVAGAIALIGKLFFK